MNIEKPKVNTFDLAQKIIAAIVTIEELEALNLSDDSLMKKAQEELDVLCDQMQDKTDAVCTAIKWLEEDSDACTAMATIFAKKALSKSNHATRLKDMMKNVLNMLQLKEIKGTLFKIKLQTSKSTVIHTDVDMEKIDARFVKITSSIIKTEVKDAIEKGEILDFAHIEEKEHIRIY